MTYFDEGDLCPECKKDIVIITQCNDTGVCSVVCQGCNYDVTDLEKEQFEETSHNVAYTKEEKE